MYRTSPTVPLICPACRNDLGRSDAWPEGAWGCQVCGGLWLDARAAKHAKLDSAVVALGEKLSAAANPPEISATEPRICCRCNETLSPRWAPGSGVQIDVCERHGTWFDAREVVRIADFARAELEREEKEIGDFVRNVRERSWEMFFQWLIKQSEIAQANPSSSGGWDMFLHWLIKRLR
jgi:Zn-finger nucleic acid-binding protein